MSKKIFKVLWFEDQFREDSLQEIADKAFDEYSIELCGCESAAEGLKILNNEETILFDAVLLDARFYLSENDISGTEDLKGLKMVWKKLDQLEALGIVIPRFILSGQTALSNDYTFSDTYGKFYSKHEPEDIDRLFNDIIIAADKRIETQIRHKYSDAFDVCTNVYIGGQNANNLMVILKGNENHDFRNASYFNDIRKIMEDVFDCCAAKGLFPAYCSSMNARSRELCNNPIIPVYIQRSIHSVVLVAQNGSHRLEIDQAVSSGNAPYLLTSTSMELLNILFWYKKYVDNLI